MSEESGSLEESNNVSWASLEAYTKSIGSIRYMNFRINVYKMKRHVRSSEDPPLYGYMPTLLLDRCSPKSRWNKVIGRAELLFTVHMWDDELEAKVFEYVKEKDANVKLGQIQVIPFNYVNVTSIAPSMQSSGWRPYHRIGKELEEVAMICSTMEDADSLANEMKTNPSQFLSILKVKFGLETQKVRTKETCISIEHIRNGELFGQLLQHFPGAETALLTADGVERLISESLTNVVANSFDDTEAVTEGSILHSKLLELIVASQVTINEQSKGMWDSVFWDENNYRPDRTAKIINDAYNNTDDQSRSKLKKIVSGTSSNSEEVDEMLKDVFVCRRSGAESSKDRQESSDFLSNSSADERAKYAADKSKSEHKGYHEQNSTEKNTSNLSADVRYAGIFSGKVDYNSADDRSSASKTASTDYQDRDSTNAKSSKTNNSKTSAGSRNNIKDMAKSSASQDDSLMERKGATSEVNEESFYDNHQKEELAKALKNSKSYVEWTGEKFQPKPMKLTRVHLAKFTNRQTFQDTRVTVSYPSAILIADLFLCPEGNCCSTQSKQLDSINMALQQQSKEFNAELVKQMELNNSMKLRMENMNDEILDKFAKQMKQKDRLESTMKKQNDDFRDKLARQTEMIDSLKSTIQKQNDETKVNLARQMELKDRLESTMQKQIDDFKDKLVKQMELNNSMKLKMENMSDEIKDKFAKQMEQKSRLESTMQKQIDDIKNKFAKELEQKNRLLATLQKQNIEFKAELAKQKERSTELHASMSGVLCRMIVLEIVCVNPSKSFVKVSSGSESFYTWQCGYRCNVAVRFSRPIRDFLGGQKMWNKPVEEPLSIAFKLVPGEYDGILKWPFSHSVTVTLYAQDTDPDQAFTKTITGPPLKRPSTSESSHYWHDEKFISYEMFKTRQFIKDGVMFLKISVDP